LPDFPAFI